MAVQHSYGKTVTSGLVLYLNAADRNSYTSGSATWQDLSGNGNSGSLTNGPTFNSANGGSIQFDGNDDYISMRNFIGNVTTFTVCKWINLSSNQTSRTIFSNYITAGGTNWVTGISDIATNVIKFYLGGGSNLYSTYPLVINTWYHVCVTYNNGNPSIYINGILNNTTAGTISFSSLATNNDIGRLGDGRQYFNGKISNIQVYNRALSATEVQQNYNASKSRFGLT